MWNKRVFFLLPPSRSPSIIPGRACKSRKQDSLQIYGSQGTCRCSVNSRKLSLHRTIHQGFPKTHVCSKGECFTEGMGRRAFYGSGIS
ncbi:uncharacterized protein [Physcomitrium patens]|uniref:uncharacterized protein isoform X4 n=1 Tax=Physcomitrium patens TaxID=3218 RepID=UPI003CCE012B